MAEYVPGSMNTLAACSVCHAVFYNGKDAVKVANDHEANCNLDSQQGEGP